MHTLEHIDDLWNQQKHGERKKKIVYFVFIPNIAHF